MRTDTCLTANQNKESQMSENKSTNKKKVETKSINLGLSGEDLWLLNVESYPGIKRFFFLPIEEIQQFKKVARLTIEGQPSAKKKARVYR